jgi:hypothetical protein
MSAMARNALVVEPESTGRRSMSPSSASCFFCFSSALAITCASTKGLSISGIGFRSTFSCA